MTSLPERRFRTVVATIVAMAVVINLVGLLAFATRRVPLVSLRVTSVVPVNGPTVCRGTPFRYRYHLVGEESGVYQITRTLIRQEDESPRSIVTGRTSYVVVPPAVDVETQEVWASDPGGSFALYEAGTFAIFIAVSGAGREMRPSVAWTQFRVLDTCE